MDWQKEAINDLREYPNLKLSLENISEQVKILEEQVFAVKATTYDKDRVSGGQDLTNDTVLNNISKRERLKFNYRSTKRLVQLMDKALAALEPNEQRVLEEFYIQHHCNYMEQLCSELGYETRQIYRIKDKALEKFTLSMYGCA